MANKEAFTTFSPQSTAKNFAPFYDSQRVYSDEHNLIIYGHSAGGHGRTFQLLDVPQRRWYEVNIPLTPSSLWPPPSLSEAEEQELENRFTEHVQNQKDIFNTITFNADGNATYEIKASIGLPLRKQQIYVVPRSQSLSSWRSRRKIIFIVPSTRVHGMEFVVFTSSSNSIR